MFSYFRPNFTGEGIYLERMADYLFDQGIVSDVVAARTQAPCVSHSDSALRNTCFFGSGRSGYINYAMAAWFARNIRNYDVVHFHAWVDRIFLYHLLAFAGGRPIVQSCTLDDSVSNYVDSYKSFYRPFVRRLSHLIDVMIAISPKLYADCLGVMPSQRVMLVPQGTSIPNLESKSRSQLKAGFGIGEDEIVLLYVGSISARKDVMLLVKSLPAIASQGQRVHLLIVGPELEDEYAAAVHKEASESSCPTSISLVGHLEDPSAAYQIADIFVFASQNEGFGNVLIEAMSYAIPVVCRRLPGVTDSIVQHGVNGYFFDTASEYARFVDILVSNPSMRREMGIAARKTVVEQFNMQSISEKYIEIYRRLAVRRHSRS